MFDIGFSELLAIGLVSLIVIGPERLPKVARTVGALLGRLQRYVSDVKSDINRELQLDEIRKMQRQVEESAREVELTIDKETSSVGDSLNSALATADPGRVPGSGGSAPGSEAVEPASAAPGTPQLELELDASAGEKKGA
ncbi:MAG TPA: twin-arginine translocase subunit TatB [Rhodocyclaceae bacterium]|nr:MAG: twin arginine-targeting protein translocase TatB [Betaproteobacteria bacterium CG2_30_68_42]PIV72174.1 MAG: twin-arginine translocase subunit TatB [Rhodocyclales bacterium CG17_big_fil_post_rev_8_21_14_2_50_68_7]PIX74495.1 MAG: twin-arginine translocase subunit TatB [Rhodocyclales bacterium CG_4_10_14_3_um_filter_68_10]PJA57731.1 MAG: twin-arginine translocase subunit TatB [Rhodocyclales bacterium CG_4_9_14_3_um_filter_68_10]HCX32866.1 twin-arginine translocase subunit TatB [Rhodocyclac